MEKEIIIKVKFDKQDVFGALSNIGRKWTDELWEKLTALPVTVDLSKVEEDTDIKEVAILIMIASLEV